MESPLKNWIPYKLVEKEEGPFFEWLYLGEHRMMDPFFEDTVAKCKSHEYHSKGLRSISSAELLLEWQSKLDSVQIRAFIFHISRCGSTMLCQLLSIPERNIVVSEAPVLDQILRSDNLSHRLKKGLFKAALSFLGQKRFPFEENLIVKLDCWHLFYLSFFRELYPSLPFVLLFRNPDEVLESHRKLRGMHLVPYLLPPSLVGWHNPSLSLDEYGALVLAKYIETIHTFHLTDEHHVVCDYMDGMEEMLNEFKQITHQSYSAKELHDMSVRLNSHSKRPDKSFQKVELLDETQTIPSTTHYQLLKATQKKNSI